MKKVKGILIIAWVFCLLHCVQGQYKIQSIESSRIAMDSTWDAKAHPQMIDLVASYKVQLDVAMNHEIGQSAQTLFKGFPQSLLSNFTADAIQEMAKKEYGKVDFAVMNMGGMRSTLNQGAITIGTMYEIYSFDNQLVLVELPGTAVQELMDFIAFHGGEGLSKSVRLLVKNRAVQSVQIGGKKIHPNKRYRIATIDYVAEGNDGMTAFQQAIQVHDSGKTLRNVMIEYVRSLTAKNQKADAKMDDRILFIP